MLPSELAKLTPGADVHLIRWSRFLGFSVERVEFVRTLGDRVRVIDIAGNRLELSSSSVFTTLEAARLRIAEAAGLSVESEVSP